jgi:hypothetical protein
VPEGQLLVAMRRVVQGVQVEGQMAGRRLERRNELVEEHVAQPLEGQDGDGVLEAGQRGLAGQVAVFGGAAGDELEDGVVAEGVMVILVLVAGQDAVDAGPDHLQERVLGEVGVARVVQRRGEPSGQADAFVELPQGQ